MFRVLAQASRRSGSVLVPVLTRRPLSSSQPPPEWVEPFLGLSDVAGAPRQPSPWLGRLVALLRDSPDPDSDLDRFCRRFLVRLSPALVAEALPALRSRPAAALRLFRWAARQPRFPRHLLRAHLALLDILAASPLPDRHASARSVLADLGPLTPLACGALMRSLGTLGMVEELLSVWRRMKDSGGEPSVETFNCLLTALVSAAFPAAARQVFDLMRRDGPTPDVVTYNIMIKSHCRAGETAMAAALLSEMDGVDGRPAADKISFMTVMQARYAEGDHGACLGLYQDMEERGLEVPPHAYTLVAAGLCREGRPFEAAAVVRHMEARGVPRNAAVYTSLLDAFSKAGDATRALEMLERMRAEGLQPDEVTHGAIVGCLSRAGRPVEAADWARRWGGNGVAYAAAIEGLGRAGMADEAVALLEEMSTAGDGTRPDAGCFNAAMAALCRAGRPEEAVGLRARMAAEGCEPDARTYAILVEGMMAGRQAEEGMRLWGEMVAAGVQPTAAAATAMVKGLCMAGKVERACRALDELAPAGVVAERAHEEMLMALCGAGRMAQACRLADGIVERGREVPGRVRTVFINALRKAGRGELAIKLMHSKIGIGYHRLGSVKRRVKFQSLLPSRT